MAYQSMKVPSEAAGWRIDRFIRSYFPDLAAETVRASFSRKDVKLDKVRVRQDQRIDTDQLVEVFYVDQKQPEVTLQIVYEDDSVLLVNKPAGISVENDGSGGLSMTDLCIRHVQAKSNGSVMIKACHRLDHKTCGLCLFAKTQDSYETLTRVFRERTLEKYYVCLVKGFMKPVEAVCKAWLKKDSDNAVVTVTDHHVPGSKEIITAYEALENGPVSRLRVHLVTGRTHQIRAHLASLGHPIMGDDLYGDRVFNKVWKSRQLKLCAYSLKLDTGGLLPQLDQVEFSIEPPF